jgi:Protein of unknown function (DUF2934)
VRLIVVRNSHYSRLRSVYDRAFRQLACEIENVTALQSFKTANPDRILEANAEIALAYYRYTEARNRLADLLLGAPAPSQPSLQERAYFLWESAGKPLGNDQEYWFRAESHSGLS